MSTLFRERFLREDTLRVRGYPESKWVVKETLSRPYMYGPYYPALSELLKQLDQL